MSKNTVVPVGEAYGDGTTQPTRIPNKGLDRISVEQIESELESEYVPFYLHDIRTNEIISFHAFLGGLTDDYSPSWETGEFYGRIDPVSIYKSTVRKINLNFWIVSTSKDDFDDMWMKINKLVTLVYPQFSRGRSLSTGDNTFIQPFSQIPTSSPIIRLRIGDVIKSNYSKFGLARIFGLNERDSVLNGESTVPNTTVESLNKITKMVQEIVSSPWEGSNQSYRFVSSSDGLNPAQNSNNSISIPIPIVVS